MVFSSTMSMPALSMSRKRLASSTAALISGGEGVLLPDTDVGQALEGLRALPFVDAAGEGLGLHESVQQAIAAQLRTTDPTWHRTLRQRAWTHLRAELRHATKPEL